MEAAAWVNLSDDELLEKKISQLGLKLDGTELQPLIQQLYDELSQKGLVFHPPCHVGDEWFVPVGIPAIFVPFFLTHERLRKLERKQMLEVEGETPEWFMRLMRHEAAHAYFYAYALQKKTKWRRIFGATSTEERRSFIARARTAVRTWCISTTGMRRVIPTRISPRRSRSGSRRASTGARTRELASRCARERKGVAAQPRLIGVEQVEFPPSKFRRRACP